MSNWEAVDAAYAEGARRAAEEILAIIERARRNSEMNGYGAEIIVREYLQGVSEKFSKAPRG